MTRFLVGLLFIASFACDSFGQSYIRQRPKDKKAPEVIIAFRGRSSVSDSKPPNAPPLWQTEREEKSPFEAASNAPPINTYKDTDPGSHQTFPGGVGSNNSGSNRKPELTISVTNHNVNPISAIRWDVVLIGKSCAGNCVVLSYRTEKRILPGKTAVLTKWTDSKNTPEYIKDAMLSGRFTWHVVIKETEYH